MGALQDEKTVSSAHLCIGGQELASFPGSPPHMTTSFRDFHTWAEPGNEASQKQLSNCQPMCF